MYILLPLAVLEAAVRTQVIQELESSTEHQGLQGLDVMSVPSLLTSAVPSGGWLKASDFRRGLG